MSPVAHPNMTFVLTHCKDCISSVSPKSVFFTVLSTCKNWLILIKITTDIIFKLVCFKNGRIMQEAKISDLGVVSVSVSQ